MECTHYAVDGVATFAECAAVVAHAAVLAAAGAGFLRQKFCSMHTLTYHIIPECTLDKPTHVVEKQNRTLYLHACYTQTHRTNRTSSHNAPVLDQHSEKPFP